MLQQLDEKLWIAEMPAALAGFEFGARMTVIRLENGKLFIHSPIELSPELKQELDKLGEIGFVVSPFKRHYMHLKEFFVAYPNARFYAPPNFKFGSLPEVHFSGRLKHTPRAEWTKDLDQTAIRGNALVDEIVFLHKPSRSLILTDLCFNIPADRSKTTQVIAGVLGVKQQLAPSRTFKLMTRNRTLLRQSIRKILKWDFDRVIIAHGDIVESGGKDEFKNAFAYLFAKK